MTKIHTMEQRSESWHEIRAGKITGTKLDALSTDAKRKTLFLEMLAERLSNDPTDDENPLMRGIRLEDEARLSYERITGRKVEQIGFAEKEGENIGDSPDGVIKDGEKIMRVLEVKCPMSKTHVNTLITKEVPKEYFWQVVHKFTVYDDIEAVDFVSYDPRISLKPFILITVNREDVADDIKLAQDRQKAFIDEINQKLIEILV